jgi:hypothetical protein
LRERQRLLGGGLDGDVVQPEQGIGGQPGEDVVAGFEWVQPRDGVQQRRGGVDRVGMGGLAEQLGLVSLMGGDQRGVVADWWVAFDALGQAQQGPDGPSGTSRSPGTPRGAGR